MKGHRQDVLKLVPDEADQGLVDVLGDLIADAKSGKLVGVRVLMNYRDSIGHVGGGKFDEREALWAFECWKHRLLHRTQHDV